MGTSVAEPTTTDAAASASATAATTATPAATTALTADSATSAATVVPETYDLKLASDLPADVKEMLDPALVERTAAIARELGLSNDAGQKLLDKQVAEVSSHAKAVAKATLDARAAAIDAEHKERVKGWEAAAKADKEFGGANYEQSLALAKQALGKFSTPEFRKALDESGMGSHPEAIRIFARIGKAMAEPEMIRGTPTSGERKSTAAVLYDHPTSQAAASS